MVISGNRSHERASHASSRTAGTGAVSPPRSQCKVHKINFSGRKEVQGTLDERIAELTELYHLDLGNTNVTGDLKIFENTKLTHLCLQNTQVAGDLSAFSQATRLKSLALQNTQVTGDLSGVSQATWLMFLSLENTQVTGDLSGLSQATRLKRLNLENTQVTGDLSGVSQATRLVFLNLGNTQVTGDLSGLSQATSLMFLYLGNTQVTGDLSGLPQKAWLKRLNLRNTTVAGDIFTLRKLPGLNSADLSRTQVSGKLDEVSWLGHSQQLQALNLAETKVALDPTSYDYFSRSCEKGDNDHCFLPKLATLDLSGCPLNSAAAHICQNLRASPSLGRLEAANAGLSGEIRTQDVLQVQAVAVDLSSNKLTHIGALPPNCQSFTAASNYGNLTFGKGVLGKAITARVSLDLWNVTFEDPTEACYLLYQRCSFFLFHVPFLFTSYVKSRRVGSKPVCFEPPSRISGLSQTTVLLNDCRRGKCISFGPTYSRTYRASCSVQRRARLRLLLGLEGHLFVGRALSKNIESAIT